jgi:hypothetical protein
MDVAFEKKFLKTMVQDFNKILIFVSGQFYGKYHAYQLVQEANIATTMTFKLDKKGTAFLIFNKIYSKFPSNPPTYEEQILINKILESL